MSGLTEILELLNSNTPEVHQAIIPTVLLPLAFLSTGISVVATFIAGLFGIKLKAEGPKKLLEVLLKPKILISALILNVLLYGGFEGWNYIKNGPIPFSYQNFRNRDTKVGKAPLQGNAALHWQQNVGEEIFAEGVIANDEIYVGSKRGNLFVLDLKTGELKDKIFFGKYLSPRPIFYNDHIYFGEGLHHSHHMRVYKLNPTTKKLAGHFETKGHTEMVSIPTTLDGEDYLFTSAGGDGLYALNPKTMEKKWNLNEGHMDSYPAIHGKFLYIGTGVPTEDIGIKRPYALKVDIKTGNIIWKKELPLSNWFGPVIIKDQVCFTMGELHVKSKLGGIQCFTHQGERANVVMIENPIMGKHFSYKDNLVFNDYKGTIYSWNLTTGNIDWTIDNHSEKYGFSSSRKLSENRYLFFNRDGKGLVYNVENGDILKRISFNKKERIYADPIVHKYGVLVFGYKGTIKNYKFPL